MKKLLIITVILSLISSCKPPYQISRSERNEMKEIYVQSFKMTYLKKMLLSGFRNSKEIKTVLNEDHSSFSEIVLTMDDFVFIDSIVAADTEKLIADSTYSIGRRAEGAAGKRVFDFALKRYESKWLKDIAKKRAKAYTQFDVTATK